MSDSQDLQRATENRDSIIVMYFCGQAIDRREFHEGLYMMSPRWGNC